MLLAWSFYTYAIFTEIKLSLKQIFIGAVAIRVIALFTNPLMEDDYFRYLWNGYQLVEIGQIRSIPPMEFFAADVPENMANILSGINNPHLPSIYSPFTEYIFALGYLLAPGKLIAIKLIYLLIEILAIWGVYKLFNAKQLLLLLWNPLLIFETYANAHPDIIAMCFLLLAWKAYKDKNWLLLGAFLGLGFSSRLFIIIALPLLLVSFRSVIGFIISSSFIYAPFLLFEKSLGSIGRFLNEWEFNSSIFGLIRSLSNYQSAKWVCASLFLVSFIIFWLKFYQKSSASNSLEQEQKTLNFDILFILLFLLSSVFNPWYCIAFIPFIIIKERYLLLFIPLALSLSYIHGLNLPSTEIAAYEVPLSILWLEYFIIYSCFLVTFSKYLPFMKKFIYTKGATSEELPRQLKEAAQKENP